MSKIVSLNGKRADVNDDNSLWTVSDMLVEALSEIQEGRVVTGAVLILLDDSGECYDVGRKVVALAHSQAIALLEFQKAVLLKEMLPE